MMAAVLYQGGPPEVLQYEEIPDPVIAPDELLMRVRSISLEGGDSLTRGRLPRSDTPHVVGYQAAGEIVALGNTIRDLAVGQTVSAFGFDGSHAELRAVHRRLAFPVPARMDIDAAAATPIAFATAHLALFDAGRLQSGETVLITAGASGVGMAAIQIAKRAGARVIASASSPEKLERLRLLGADLGINSSSDDVAAAARAATGGLGVDVAIDMVGGDVLQELIHSLAYRGRIALVGAAGRQSMRVDVGPLQRAEQSMTGVFLGPLLAGDAMQALIPKYLKAVADGEFAAPVDRVFPLAEAAAAHAYAESRRAIGRIIIRPEHR